MSARLSCVITFELKLVASKVRPSEVTAILLGRLPSSVVAIVVESYRKMNAEMVMNMTTTVNKARDFIVEPPKA